MHVVKFAHVKRQLKCGVGDPTAVLGQDVLEEGGDV